jgi:hypothetical protein
VALLPFSTIFSITHLVATTLSQIVLAACCAKATIAHVSKTQLVRFCHPALIVRILAESCRNVVAKAQLPHRELLNTLLVRVLLLPIALELSFVKVNRASDFASYKGVMVNKIHFQ